MEKKRFSIIFIFLSLLTACVIAPPPSNNNYAQTEKNVTINDKDRRSFKIYANKAWQQPGVYLTKGATVSIRANGKWSPWPEIGIHCEPNGDASTGVLVGEVSWVPPCALMAKLGHQGRPFLVGSETEFTAEQEGHLFFAINDPFNYLFNNTGELSVSVTVDFPKTTSKNGAIDSVNTSKSSSTSALPQNTLSSLGTDTQKRIALVIGNTNYELGALTNPENDAQDMAKVLSSLGFEVITGLNLTQQRFDEVIRDFGRRLQADSVALFYYAGHAIQMNGENYLIPLQSGIQRQSDVRYKAVNVGQILSEMESANNSLNIIILDACRDNPLPRSFRSGQQGLAKIDALKGTVIAYATSPGSLASDGEGRNGLYTKHILSHIKTEGLTIEQLFKKVLQGVSSESGGQQTPWMSSSFTGEFSFAP